MNGDAGPPTRNATATVTLHSIFIPSPLGALRAGLAMELSAVSARLPLTAYRSRFSAQDKLRKQAYAHPRRPFDTGCVLAVGVGGPGDVEVGPGKAVHELA